MRRGAPEKNLNRMGTSIAGTHVTEELFRREAIEAKRRGWLGSICLAQPVRLWVLTLASVLAATAVASFLALGTYTRRSTVVGQLVPSKGLATVTAPATGIVSRMEVVEGDRVLQGQVLALVTVQRATVDEGDTLVALEQRIARRRQGLVDGQTAQRQLLTTQDGGLRSQLLVAQQELAQIEAEAATRSEQIRLADETLQRLKQLEGQRYVSLLQIKQQESIALSWRAEMQALQRQAIVVRRSIAQLRQALEELPGQGLANDAGVARELAQLEQEEVETQARGALTVNAPVAG